MNILCTICRDLVTTENLCTTKCGHLFHRACVNQWLARSNSCPQCRSYLKSKWIFRLYLTTPEEDAPGNDNAATLQAKLDKTMLELRQKSMEITGLEQKLLLAKVNLNLEETNNLLKAEKEKRSHDSEIAVYRQKFKYLEIRHNKLQKEFKQSQKKVQALQGLQMVFNGTVQEVERFLNSSPDLRTVVTYATALKKALFESEAKRSELENKLQGTSNELQPTTRNLAKKQGDPIEYIKYTDLLKACYMLEETKLDKAFSGSSSEDTPKPTCHIPNDVCVVNTSDTSLNTQSNSPYFDLKKHSLGWACIQKPILRHLVPNVTSEHRLKRPNSDVTSLTEFAKKPRPFDK